MTLPITCKYKYVSTIDFLPVLLTDSLFDDNFDLPYLDSSYVRLFPLYVQGCTGYNTSQTITAVYCSSPITIVVEGQEESSMELSTQLPKACSVPCYPHDAYNASIESIDLQSKILPWMYLPTVNNDFSYVSRTTIRDLQREDDTYFIWGETWQRYPLNYYVKSFESCTLGIKITFRSSTQSILLEEIITVNE